MIGDARGHPLTWSDVDVNKYNDLNFHTVPKLGDLLLQDSVEDKHWNGLKKKKSKNEQMAYRFGNFCNTQSPAVCSTPGRSSSTDSPAKHQEKDRSAVRHLPWHLTHSSWHNTQRQADVWVDPVPKKDAKTAKHLASSKLQVMNT